MQGLPLLMLMVFVLCTSVCNSVSWTESQNQEIELGSVYVPDSSKGDRLIGGVLPVKNVNDLLLVLDIAEQVSAIISGSDAYPGCILHGPPA
jgi:hypothetical protein